MCIWMEASEGEQIFSKLLLEEPKQFLLDDHHSGVYRTRYNKYYSHAAAKNLVIMAMHS